MMYILTEEEYRNLTKNKEQGEGLPVEFLSHFAFFDCPECGRVTAIEKSQKDSATDVATLAQGCPSCGENVLALNLSPEDLITRVLKK